MSLYADVVSRTPSPDPSFQMGSVDTLGESRLAEIPDRLRQLAEAQRAREEHLPSLTSVTSSGGQEDDPFSATPDTNPEEDDDVLLGDVDDSVPIDRGPRVRVADGGIGLSDEQQRDVFAHATARPSAALSVREAVDDESSVSSDLSDLVPLIPIDSDGEEDAIPGLRRTKLTDQHADEAYEVTDDEDEESTDPDGSILAARIGRIAETERELAELEREVDRYVRSGTPSHAPTARVAAPHAAEARTTAHAPWLLFHRLDDHDPRANLLDNDHFVRTHFSTLREGVKQFCENMEGSTDQQAQDALAAMRNPLSRRPHLLSTSHPTEEDVVALKRCYLFMHTYTNLVDERTLQLLSASASSDTLSESQPLFSSPSLTRRQETAPEQSMSEVHEAMEELVRFSDEVDARIQERTARHRQHSAPALPRLPIVRATDVQHPAPVDLDGEEPRAQTAPLPAPKPVLNRLRISERTQPVLPTLVARPSSRNRSSVRPSSVYRPARLDSRALQVEARRPSQEGSASRKVKRVVHSTLSKPPRAVTGLGSYYNGLTQKAKVTGQAKTAYKLPQKSNGLSSFYANLIAKRHARTIR